VGSEPRDNGVRNENGATVLTGVALTDGRGSLLGTMRGKIPNLRIHRPSNEPCPVINLRNVGSFNSEVVNPHVYVDGVRTTDTCVLESLRSDDVESVEVYPMGFTPRPGYANHSHGLILVFMRSAG